MIKMLKRHLLIIWLGLLLLPALHIYALQEEYAVYRLLQENGEVVAYTEFRPHIGDLYWQADADIWYRVVRLEADIGWLVVTERPTEGLIASRQVVPYYLLSIALVFVLAWFLLRWRNR